VKKGAIIGLIAGGFGVVFAVMVFPIGGTGIDFVEDIVPYDCAKGWDDMRESLRLQDYDAFQELPPEEKRKVRQYETKINDDMHGNWCSLNHEEWQDRVKDKDGRFALVHGANHRDNWQYSIDVEYEYNERFPDGALQFQ